MSHCLECVSDPQNDHGADDGVCYHLVVSV